MARTQDPTKAIKALSGIGAKLCKRIIEELGQGDPWEAYGTIERNPYRLIEVEGIGFKKADKCAMTDFMVPTDDVRRHHAGNQFILEGSGVMTLAEFAAERVKLGLFDQDHQHASVQVEGGKVWLPLELEAELGLCDWLAGLPSHQPLMLATLTPQQQAVCDAQGLDDVQRDAVRAALANRVVIIDGGAGCGKTHVVATLTACLALVGKRTRGMAFAGKAADRMREAFARYGISAEASTIHKALGYAKGGFTVDLLAEDLIVVDESSMLPNWLLWAVVQALPEWATLVLVGDRNQLPPIGHGTPFVDAIAHGVPRAHLSKNYRQADQQGILQMAEGVLHRKRPNPASCVQMMLGVPEPKLQDTFSTLVQQQGGLDFEGWQAISWKNEDVERYNLTAQALLNPDGQPLAEYPCWKLGTDPDTRAPLVRAEIRTGDKVIIIKNSTMLGIFNGQTGTARRTEWRAQQVQRKDADGRWVVQDGEECPHLVVSITGTEVAIPLEDIEKQLQLGYVITVHKAQGSDWDRVIIMQPSKLREDSARRWYYTAITRAKVQLVVVSMLTVVGWWQNAAADAPDVPSSLMKRLAKQSEADAVQDAILASVEDWGCDVCGRTAAQYKDCGSCNGSGQQPDPIDVTWAELKGNNKASMPILGAAIEAVTQYLDQPTREGNADRLQLLHDLRASFNELATLEEFL